MFSNMDDETMTTSKAVKELTELLRIMEKYANTLPALPEEGCFYRTYNSSIVYIYEVSHFMVSQASAVVIRGGAGRVREGDNYCLELDGYHADKEIGPHVVLALAEKLDIQIPGQQ